jgi:protocatechuate 3,4-dioxygenase beta subunit
LIEDTGKPFADLAVTAERLDDASGQLAVAKSYSAKTDDLGRFRIHTIPPGKYRISATPPAPASGAKLYYPGTEKIEDAEILQIAPGQNFDNLTFAAATAALPAIAAEAMATQELEALSAPTRGGTWAQITGRVTRADVGQPIPNAAVKLSSSGGVLLRTAWTDGAGQYSFSRVIPGAYQLAVSSDGYARTPGSTDRITVADGERLKKELVLTPLVAVEGRALDEFGDPVPGVVLRASPQASVVSAAEARPTSTMTGLTDDRGWFRISGLLAANYNLIALPEPFARSGPVAFPISFTPLQLAAGIDAHGVNLVLPAVPTTPTSGTVVDATGRRMPKVLVTLSPILDGQSKGFRASANADANGDFVFPFVAAGTYLVEAMGPGALEVGSLTITTPIEPFALALKPLPTARGRVTFDGDAPPEIKPQIRELYIRRGLLRFQPIGPRLKRRSMLAGRRG